MIPLAELIVVEGRTDVVRLAALFDADFYATGGSAVTAGKIAEIKALAGDRGIVLFLDNDQAGEAIRRRLEASLPPCRHAFVTEPWGKGGQVALASDATLLQALSLATKGRRRPSSLRWDEYLALGLLPCQRRALCTVLAFSWCNNKQFFKRANMIGLGLGELRQLRDAGL